MTGATQNLDQSQNQPASAVFRRRHKLAGGDFAPVFQARLRKSRGPITVHMRPNGLAEHRLGLSIGRKLGGAIRRNKFKRQIREVFRFHRASLPFPTGDGGYDIVVSARAHEPLGYEQCRDWFMEAVQAAHRVHEKRHSEPAEPGDG